MEEIRHLEFLVCSSQDLLHRQVMMFTQQMEKLAIAERDNEKLIMDTQELFEKIIVIKEKESSQTQ